MGNLTVYKQEKDGLFYAEINALKPEIENTTDIESRFKPIYPGESDHTTLQLPQRTVSQTEKVNLDIVEQLTQLVIAQRAYEMEVKKLQESI